jgi:hypothetical protein
MILPGSHHGSRLRRQDWLWNYRRRSVQHPLYQQQAIAIGQRCDCDDVLFHLPASSVPYAMVHLTWSGKTEPVGWPATSLYTSLEDWIKQCMQPDHETYRGEA